MEILDIVKTAVRAIDSKQGLDTEVIRITDLTVLADYFVIATAPLPPSCGPWATRRSIS